MSDIRILPSLVSHNIKNETEVIVRSELEKRIQKTKLMIDNGSPDEERLKGWRMLPTICCQSHSAIRRIRINTLSIFVSLSVNACPRGSRFARGA